MNFPGHNYLGPGNPIFNGVPIDEDDKIAQLHDWEYEQATRTHHIRKADRRAIGKFARDFLGNRNWHSLIGATGLSAKYGVETVTGVMYPARENIYSDGKNKNMETIPEDEFTKEKLSIKKKKYAIEGVKQEKEKESINSLEPTMIDEILEKIGISFKTCVLIVSGILMMTSVFFMISYYAFKNTTEEKTHWFEEDLAESYFYLGIGYVVILGALQWIMISMGILQDKYKPMVPFIAFKCLGIVLEVALQTIIAFNSDVGLSCIAPFFIFILEIYLVDILVTYCNRLRKQKAKKKLHVALVA